MNRIKHILRALFANKQTSVALAMAVVATLAYNTFADSLGGQLVVRTYQNTDGQPGYQPGVDKLLGGEPVKVECVDQRGKTVKPFSAPPKRGGQYVTAAASGNRFGTARFRVTNSRRGMVTCTTTILANGAHTSVMVTPNGVTPVDLYRK